MKKVALIIASLGMMSGVAVAHHGGSHALAHHGGPHNGSAATAAQAKAEAGFRFAVGTTAGKVKKMSADNCHAHDGVVHCHD
jgi:hypothetical protein